MIWEGNDKISENQKCCRFLPKSLLRGNLTTSVPCFSIQCTPSTMFFPNPILTVIRVHPKSGTSKPAKLWFASQNPSPSEPFLEVQRARFMFHKTQHTLLPFQNSFSKVLPADIYDLRERKIKPDPKRFQT